LWVCFHRSSCINLLTLPLCSFWINLHTSSQSWMTTVYIFCNSLFLVILPFQFQNVRYSICAWQIVLRMAIYSFLVGDRSQRRICLLRKYWFRVPKIVYIENYTFLLLSKVTLTTHPSHGLRGTPKVLEGKRKGVECKRVVYVFRV
jgi:hypothetical protein